MTQLRIKADILHCDSLSFYVAGPRFGGTVGELFDRDPQYFMTPSPLQVISGINLNGPIGKTNSYLSLRFRQFL